MMHALVNVVISLQVKLNILNVIFLKVNMLFLYITLQIKNATHTFEITEDHKTRQLFHSQAKVTAIII